MKHLIIVSLFLIISCCLFAQETEIEQDTTTKQDKEYTAIIKTDVFMPVVALMSPYDRVNRFILSYEKLLKNNKSFQLSSTYINIRVGIKEQDRSVHIIPEFRFYLSKKKSHKGLYMGPYMSYILRKHKNVDYYFEKLTENNNYSYHRYELIENDKCLIHSIALGGIFGYQFKLAENIHLDFISGIGLRQHIYTNNEKFFKMFYLSEQTRISGRIGFNIGYKF